MKKNIAEIIESLKNGVSFSNELSGWSYSKGATMIKICVDGKLKFYTDIEKMAKDILKSQNTGV